MNIKSTCRMALSLGLIGVSVLWIAIGVGLIPNTRETSIKRRIEVCETMSVAATALIVRRDHNALQQFLERMGDRTSEVLSIRLIRNGKRFLSWGADSPPWDPDQQQSTEDRMAVEIFDDRGAWGTIQVFFQPLKQKVEHQQYAMTAFCGALSAVFAWIFLFRSLRYLNPTKVVPNRVRHALDVITEGLVLQDSSGQIVMVNKAFCEIVDSSLDELLCGRPEEFDWRLLKADNDDGPVVELPWAYALDNAKAIDGVMLGLPVADGGERKFIVNSTPLLEEDGSCRGALTSFQDVSVLENKRQELSKMLVVLEKSRDEIRQKNENLEYLASRDPMTGALNRRCFFERADNYWNDTSDSDLSIIMLDIDHFKSINDNYGHGVGDQVIKHVARTATEIVGETGLVCRYGGEEFCIAFPNVDYDRAIRIGEEIRTTIAATEIEGVSLTMSVGVSTRKFLAMDLQHMLEQADQALYAAKNSGRNRVVGWQQVAEMQVESSVAGSLIENETSDRNNTEGISQNNEAVVASLFQSLCHRDEQAAQHAARVANLAVNTAAKILDNKYVDALRVAALLHDIGRIGLSDSFVAQVRRSDATQAELSLRSKLITDSICRSAELSSTTAMIIDHFRQPYADGKVVDRMAAISSEVQFCCRILNVCDTFDQLYRSGEHANTDLAIALSRLQSRAGEFLDPVLIQQLRITIANSPQCLDPIAVPGMQFATCDIDSSADIAIAAEAGNMQPLRLLVRKLKREALSQDNEFQSKISHLELSLAKQDHEIQMLFRTTQDLLEMCRNETSLKTGSLRPSDVNTVG